MFVPLMSLRHREQLSVNHYYTLIKRSEPHYKHLIVAPDELCEAQSVSSLG